MMALSYLLPILFYCSLAILGLMILRVGYEYFILSSIANNIQIKRDVHEQMSLGDRQFVDYEIKNTGDRKCTLELIDELPHQLQDRNVTAQLTLEPNSDMIHRHPYRPVVRGEYDFGDILAYLSLRFALISYKKTMAGALKTSVYPSILQMRKYAIQIFSMTASLFGIRKIRTVGENNEFEHIRQYHQGDNIKSINWKATSRRGELVVNQYQDTRSQRVYCVIDKGRTMELPFDELSLLDYSINSALVISNIVLQKYDNAGLITFGKNLDTFIPADSKSQQLELILEQLYKESTDYLEADFEKLYFTCRSQISRRSILFLFTNIETKQDLDYRLDYLKGLSKRHLLIVISFINTELDQASNREVNGDMDQLYFQTVATTFKNRKIQLMKELRHHGIQVIYTTPKNLSINVINKYLEIKAKQMQ